MPINIFHLAGTVRTSDTTVVKLCETCRLYAVSCCVLDPDICINFWGVAVLRNTQNCAHFFIFSRAQRCLLPTHPPFQRVPNSLPWGRSIRDTDPTISPPSSPGFKNHWSYTTHTTIRLHVVNKGITGSKSIVPAKFYPTSYPKKCTVFPAQFLLPVLGQWPGDWIFSLVAKLWLL